MRVLFLAFLIGLLNFQSSLGQLPKLNSYQYRPITPDVDWQLLLKIQQMRADEVEREMERRKEKALALSRQTANFYSSLSEYPARIIDGWHNVVATNNSDFCDDRKVYVSNNKITKYVINNWQEKVVSISSDITRGKSYIKLDDSGGTAGSYLDIYFIEYCTRLGSTTTAPLKPGSIMFWSRWKRAETITVYLQDIYNIGTMRGMFYSQPVCGQDGGVTFTFKPGTYTYKAVGISALGSEVNWQGTLTLREGDCSMLELSRN
ncbi:hypothetical protein JYG30_04030 [Fibrella sp. USSR17]